MNFSEQNWQQVEQYLTRDDRVMLVLGACEQHSTLSLLTDSKIPLALAEAASEKTGVLVAPPLHFGITPYFLSFPGTISIRSTTYLFMVEDIVRSLYGHGFKHILVLNGHGGNAPAKTSLVELVKELPDLHLRWYAWWLSPAAVQFAQQHQRINAHANWSENFPFTRIENASKQDKPPVVYGPDILGKDLTRQDVGDGSYGGAYQVPDELMQTLFDLCLTEVLTLLNFD